MKRGFWVFRVLWLVVAVLGFAASTAAAQDVIFTVRGKALLPDGRPAAGIPILLQSATPQGHDVNNTYWKIPNFDSHRMVTDTNGEFVLTNVIDYAENKEKAYVVVVDNAKVSYHGSVRFKLRPEAPVIQATLQLDDVTIVRLHLRDRNGRSFEGTRAVWLNTGSGAATRDLANGYNQLKTVIFVNGVGTVKVPVRDRVTYRGRLALLNYPTADAAKADLRAKGMQTGDDRFDALKFTMRDSHGRPMDLPLKLLPQQTQDFEFTI